MIEKAPEPVLNVGVRQGGKLVAGDLNVSPGIYSIHRIYLDRHCIHQRYSLAKSGLIERSTNLVASIFRST